MDQDRQAALDFQRPKADAPEPVVDLDARALRAWIEPADPGDDGGDLVVHVDDGDTAVRILPGAGGNAEDAILGLERLASVALRLAAMWKLRGVTAGHPVGPMTGPW